MCLLFMGTLISKVENKIRRISMMMPILCESDAVKSTLYKQKSEAI